MLYSHFTEELLNLQEVIVKKIEKFENVTHVHIEMPVTEHICPVCGEKNKYIHDYIFSDRKRRNTEKLKEAA